MDDQGSELEIVPCASLNYSATHTRSLRPTLSQLLRLHMHALAHPQRLVQPLPSRCSPRLTARPHTASFFQPETMASQAWPRTSTHTLASLLHHRHPGTFSHPRRSSATTAGVAAGSRRRRVPVRTLQFWSWSRCAYSLSSAGLPLHHEHIASLLASAATIHPRGLGFES